MKYQTEMRNVLFRSLFVCLIVLVLSLHLCSSVEPHIHDKVLHKINSECLNSNKTVSKASIPSIFESFTTSLFEDLLGRKSSRKKRSIMKRYKRNVGLIFPGTKWCGINNNAANYSDLGVSVHTDKCCREHDQCPRYILAGKENYGLQNQDTFTRSDCKCDNAFRDCLHLAKCEAPLSRDRFTAGFVGMLYFTDLNTYCIKFPEGNCTK
ncbi:phospholipase A2 [Octopus sinensis]|uniref:Phospholipase A2 n=1 Tax=Octopus sinensis TaxID=2607531 RepID=A0A6P7TW68_9MOLL|nr:phospholipase A2 [Octopus sinensis]